MQASNFDPLINAINAIPKTRAEGSISAVSGHTIKVKGLSRVARSGDIIEIESGEESAGLGEVLSLSEGVAEVLPEKQGGGFALNDRVSHIGALNITPDVSWLGRVIDPFGRPLDGKMLPQGDAEMPLRASPPAAATRKKLGSRLHTGLAAFDTHLPIVRGQRIGLFAGSGVGKSTLLADLAKGISADVVVIALVGERGRELNEFIDNTLGPDGLAKSVVIAATSDQSPLSRRRAGLASMAVAEYFRDQGENVLYLVDSITRFAEAHREIAIAAGEEASLRGFPPSTSQALMSLSERAGPGTESQGDITAIFSVLVAGSDMEEPVADIMRGVLDGHVVLDRAIAERGRFPAIDMLRSVSRSLPEAATQDENDILAASRRHMATFAEAELMIQAGLYATGTDPDIDAAIAIRPKLEVFLSKKGLRSFEEGFVKLKSCLALDTLHDKN